MIGSRERPHPALILFSCFAAQFCVWWMYASETPATAGVAPRFFDWGSIQLWGVLFGLLLLGISVGGALGRSLIQRPRRAAAVKHRDADGQRWLRWAKCWLVVAAVGEVVYVRNIASYWHGFHILDAGLVEDLSANVRLNKVRGVSSLNNCVLLAVAILAMLGWGGNTDAKTRKQARILLLVTGVYVLAHSLIVAERMVFVNTCLVTVAAAGSSIWRNAGKRGRLALIGLGCGIPVAIILGEYFRSGIYWANEQNLPIWSLDVLKYVNQRVAEAYVSNDLNNAFFLLSQHHRWNPTYASAFEAFSARTREVYLESSFGTVNVLAIWWVSFGYFSSIVAFAHGLIIGTAAGCFQRDIRHMCRSLWYVLIFPALFAFTRLNYCLMSMFILPAMGLVFTTLVEHLFPPRDAVRSRVLTSSATPGAGVHPEKSRGSI